MGSRSADIDFAFRCPTTVRAVPAALTGAGWSAEEAPGHISYLINDADDMFQTTRSSGTPRRPRA
ncbi:hypothetical protein ACFVJ8_19525 [Streptomyces yangpuensis]|uniref:hypothetical protein n=1 Tax=Streptomyces TaxID=1883 RepID=UPI000ACAD849|nr:hypothetical protein [Streptomyces sp. NRRL S-378]